MCGGSDKPEQSEEEKELGRIAVEKWNTNQDTYYDLQNDYIEDVQMGGADFAEGRGRAATANNMAFGDARMGLSDQLTAGGMAPDSGRYMSAMNNLTQDQGLAMGTGINEADMAIDNAGLAGLQSAVDIGLGQEAQAFGGMSSVAADATRDSIDRANRAFDRSAATQHLVGNVAGAATQYGMRSSAPDMSNNTAYIKRS